MTGTSIAMLVAGIAFIALSAWRQLKDRRLVERCTQTTQGVVVEVDEDNDVDSATTHNIMVEYSVGDRTYTLRYTSTAARSKIPAPGDRVTVYYDPSQPDQGYTKSSQAGLAVWIGYAAGIATILFALKSR